MEHTFQRRIIGCCIVFLPYSRVSILRVSRLNFTTFERQIFYFLLHYISVKFLEKVLTSVR